MKAKPGNEVRRATILFLLEARQKFIAHADTVKQIDAFLHKWLGCKVVAAKRKKKGKSK